MKLVKEHINEKFKENSDPIKDMGIGLSPKMKKFIAVLDKELQVGEPYNYYTCQEGDGEYFSAITFEEIVENVSPFIDYMKKRGIIIDEIRFKREG